MNIEANPEDALQKVLKKYTDEFMGRAERRVEVTLRLYPEELQDLAGFLTDLFKKRPPI